MKKPLIFDIVFMVLLAFILVILNEIQIISLEDHSYIFIALLGSYFIGRRVGSFSRKE
jgi:hypothetical protein